MTVNPVYCTHNHQCPAVKACEAGAITQKGTGRPHIDTTRCTGCKKCMFYCHRGAISESI